MIRTERQRDGSYLLEYNGKHYECENWDAVIRKLKEIWEREDDQE